MHQNTLVGRTIPFGSSPVEIVEVIKTTPVSTILLATDATEKKFALKYCPFYSSGSQESYIAEMNAIRLIGACPQIIPLIENIELQGEPRIGVLKLEYCARGNLREFVATHSISEAQALHIFKELLLALVKIQDNNIIHRDLCPENILVTDAYEFKLADFGNAARVEFLLNLDPVAVKGNMEKCSNPLYRPPELELAKFDIYSAGVVFYFLLTGQLYKSGQSEFAEISPRCTEILRTCLNPNAQNRGAARSILMTISNENPIDDWPQGETPLNCEKKSVKFCLQECLGESTESPDMHYLNYLMLKAWNVPTCITKIYNHIINTERFLTIRCLKILIVVHRMMISGPIEVLLNNPGPKQILEGMLNEWIDKQKHFKDNYFCAYFCGLVRQMCRILIDKIDIHYQTSTQGNWKQPIRPEYYVPTIRYLNNVLRVCDGLIMGITDLDNLMNFLTMQLVEECNRLRVLLISILRSEIEGQTTLGTELTSIFSRVDDLNGKIAKKMAGRGRAHQAKAQNGVQAALSTAEARPRSPAPAKAVTPVQQRNAQMQQFMNLVPIVNQDYNQMSPVIEFPQHPVIFNQPKAPEAPNVSELIGSRWLIKQNEIRTERVLGSGASCTVYKGTYKRTPVAIKIVKSGQMGASLEREFEREVKAMLLLRHPNLVLFMGACREPQMIIVSEFCAGGSLFTLLHERRDIVVSWAQRLKIIKDVARGMLYLHEVDPPILHRDLKSLNLLVNDEVRGPNDTICIKITDFGVARILDQAELLMTGQMGTCHWMAPEVLNSQPYSLGADVYSFGIVLYEIVTREIPYRNLPQMTIPMRVTNGERPNMSVIPSSCPEALKELMRRCWHQNPDQRPKFDQVLDVLDSINPASLR